MIGNIGTIIKALRHKSKLTQSEICEDFMDRTMLSKIENNILMPNIKQLEFIAKKLDISIYSFFNSLDYITYNNNSAIGFEDSFLLRMYNNKTYNEIIKLFEFDSKRFILITDSYKNFYVGMSYFNLGIYNSAIKLLRKYINAYLKSSNKIQEVQVINFSISLNTISKIMFQNSNYIKAKQHLYLARKYLSKYNKFDSTISFFIHSNLAYTYNCLNEFDNSISLLEEFIASNNQIFNIKAMPYIHWSLGKAYYNINKYDTAISHINKSIYLLRYCGNMDEVGRCYINYINILRYSKKFTEALRIIRMCKREYRLNKVLTNKFLIEEIAVYFNLGSFDKVLTLYKDIKYTQLGEMYRYCLYLILGHTYYMLNNLDKSKNYLIKCQKYFIEQDYSYDLCIVYEDLYNMTKSKSYLEKLNHYKNTEGKRNIVV
jgi:transcriptional regulator with XRE-family HTH domain